MSVDGRDATLPLTPWTNEAGERRAHRWTADGARGPVRLVDRRSLDHARYHHACAVSWRPEPAELARWSESGAWRSVPATTLFVATDETVHLRDPFDVDSPRGGDVCLPIVLVPTPAGLRPGSGDHQEARECLAAETHLLGVDREACADALCFHDLATISGRKLLHLLQSHDRLVVGSREISEPPAVAADQPGRLRLLRHVTSVLALVDDRTRLAELVAGLLAGLTGAPLVAVAFDTPTGTLVAGEEAGRPLTSPRRRELASQPRADNIPPGSEVFEIHGCSGSTIGAVLVDRTGGDTVDDGGVVETLTSLLGLRLGRLAADDELRSLAQRRDELALQLEQERAATALLTTLADRLADRDVDGVLAEVSRVLGVRAALVSVRGAVLAGAVRLAPSPDRLRATTRGPFPTAGHHVADRIHPVRGSGGDVLAYLCLEDACPGPDAALAAALTSFLPVVAAAQLDRRDSALRSASAFVLSLLFAGDEFPEGELRRWACRLDVDLSVLHRVAFLTQLPSPDDLPRLEREQRVHNALSAAGDPPLLAGTRDGLICLCPDPSSLPSSRWIEAWEHMLPELAHAGFSGVTLGGAFAGVAGVRRSYEQARALAERHRTHGRVLAVRGVVVYEDVGISELVLGHPDSEGLCAYVRRVLGPLLDDTRFGGELADTLQAYLATGGSPTSAAQLLHLHPSSVKYRMRIIREIVGSDQLEDHEHRFELELALRMLRTLKDLKGEAGNSISTAVAAGHR